MLYATCCQSKVYHIDISSIFGTSIPTTIVSRFMSNPTIVIGFANVPLSPLIAVFILITLMFMIKNTFYVSSINLDVVYNAFKSHN